MTKSKAETLAEILEGDYCPDWLYETGVDEIAAHLRAQDALIGELVEVCRIFDLALLAAFPDGGWGKAFDHWNAAREALAKAEAAR